ncbi:MAG: hypothetical protein CM15mP68_3640 [Pseudomonadota bacterium]|nr:MAG: hypothetical protein CM15mP68_3640 [Pseudomonadota bacterium]
MQALLPWARRNCRALIHKPLMRCRSSAWFFSLSWPSMLRGGWRTRHAQSAEQTAQPPSQHPLGFAADGFLIVFFNPKIAIFFFAIFSQFLTTDLSLTTRLTMASLAGTIDALWYCAIAALVSLPFVQTRLREYAWQLDIAFGAALLVIMLLLI